jgi:hypothetical protein
MENLHTEAAAEEGPTPAGAQNPQTPLSRLTSWTMVTTPRSTTPPEEGEQDFTTPTMSVHQPPPEQNFSERVMEWQTISNLPIMTQWMLMTDHSSRTIREILGLDQPDPVWTVRNEEITNLVTCIRRVSPYLPFQTEMITAVAQMNGVPMDYFQVEVARQMLKVLGMLHLGQFQGGREVLPSNYCEIFLKVVSSISQEDLSWLDHYWNKDFTGLRSSGMLAMPLPVVGGMLMMSDALLRTLCRQINVSGLSFEFTTRNGRTYKILTEASQIWMTLLLMWVMAGMPWALGRLDYPCWERPQAIVKWRH